MSEGRQYRERLQYQLRFFVDAKVFKTKEAADDAVRRAKEYFYRTGKELKGVRIEGRFRNPDREGVHAARWKTTNDPGQSLDEFWRTLKRAFGQGRRAF